MSFSEMIEENLPENYVQGLRAIAYEGADNLYPLKEVDYRYCEDQKYSSIHIDDIRLGENETHIAECLWICWYKSRAYTDAIWLLSTHSVPRLPTLEECKAILTWFKNKYPFLRIEI